MYWSRLMIIFFSRGSSMPICRLCSTKSSLYTNWVFLSWIHREHIFVKIILSHDYDSSWTSIWTTLRPFDDKYSFAQKYGLTYSWLDTGCPHDLLLLEGGLGDFSIEVGICTLYSGFHMFQLKPIKSFRAVTRKKPIYSYSSVLLKEHDSYTFLLSIL